MAITLSKKNLEALGLKLGDGVKIEFVEGKNQILISPSKTASQLPLDLHIRPKLGSKR